MTKISLTFGPGFWCCMQCLVIHTTRTQSVSQSMWRRLQKALIDTGTCWSVPGITKSCCTVSAKPELEFLALFPISKHNNDGVVTLQLTRCSAAATTMQCKGVLSTRTCWSYQVYLWLRPIKWKLPQHRLSTYGWRPFSITGPTAWQSSGFSSCEHNYWSSGAC